MGVDYRTAVGYGIVLTSAQAQDLVKDLPLTEQDDFFDEYCPYINSWTGEERFLGLVDDLGDEDCVFIDDLGFSHEEIRQFEAKVIDGLHLRYRINWEPKLCVIRFCY